MSESVSFQIRGSVATLTLTRPEKRNAFDDDTIQLLIDYLAAARDADAVRLLVLNAEGDHFSAGGDLNWMKRMANFSEADNLADAKQLATLMHALHEFPKHTLATVQGAVYGGGVGLVCACDSVLAADDARFCLSEVNIGLIPAVIGPYVMEAMGPRRAKHYMMTGRVFDAHQAHQYGVVHEVVSRDELEAIQEAWVKQSLGTAPIAQQTVKAYVARTKDRQLDTQTLTDCARLIATLRVSTEGQEGLSAFLEKRDPSWKSS